MKSVSNYEPGTVAVATVPNYAEPLIDGCDTYEARVSRYSDGWALLSDPDIFWPDHRGQVSNVRPLLVLDLGPDEWPLSLQWVAIWLRDFEELRHGNPDWAVRCRMIRRIADQIEAQTKPPRIPEPGLWAVVRDRKQHHWIHSEPDRWFNMTTGQNWPWVDIEDAELIHEGLGA